MHEILQLLSNDFMGKPIWMWIAFLAIVMFLLVLDLGLFNREDHVIEVKESLKMSAFYIAIGVSFGGWVWWKMGAAKAMEYLTGFVVEKTLAMDNIFVIAMIFSYLSIPRLYQHRVLFWGILGVILLRGVMIGVGAGLVHEFEWILWFFAAFLVFTGVKMLFAGDQEMDIGENVVLKFMHKHFRITKQLHGHDFFVRKPAKEGDETGKSVLYITPLFLALVMIEIADVIFAVDSIPAIFAITTDAYIVFTSNIFAILGLRALYFALAAMISRFAYLKYALSIVLIFIGSKIVVADMLGIAKIPPAISMGITIAIIASGVIYSLFKTKNQPAE